MAERVLFYNQINKNKRNSIFLVIIVLAILVLIGYVIGMALGPDYFTIVMILAIIISLIYVWVQIELNIIHYIMQ